MLSWSLCRDVIEFFDVGGESVQEAILVASMSPNTSVPPFVKGKHRADAVVAACPVKLNQGIRGLLPAIASQTEGVRTGISLFPSANDMFELGTIMGMEHERDRKRSGYIGLLVAGLGATYDKVCLTVS